MEPQNLSVYDYIWHINSANKPVQVQLPVGEKLYPIDLNTRKIFGPEELSVKENHESDLVYFTVDRYYDNVDLAETVCVVQYETKNKNDGSLFRGSYFIPLYDVTTLKDEEKIILPWQIRRYVTQTATQIKYNFRFYQIDPSTNELIYNLNTLTTTGKILDTLDYEQVAYPEDDKFYRDSLDEIRDIIHRSLQWNQTNWEILD